MRTVLFVPFCLAVLTIGCGSKKFSGTYVNDPAAAQSKSAPKSTKDAFPTGHASPEGVACDLARAFIKRDVALFGSTCIKPFGGGESRKEYEAFLKKMSSAIEQEAKKKPPTAGGPKSISKAFAARRLTKNGPASYGYAVFDFKDVQFVDVRVVLQNGQASLNRTLVIQDRDGKWYVHPAPSLHPLLSEGLNDEKPST